MPQTTIRFVCSCKIKNGSIEFCPLHGATEELLNALIYARDVLAETPLAMPAREKLKIEVALPHIDKILKRALSGSAR
jgi:hypothetical protein